MYAAPSLGDRTNLGGGLFARNLTRAHISGNTRRLGENGIDLYSVTKSDIDHNTASDNTGWGVHLNASTGSNVHDNIADRCTRTGLFDSAGFLLVVGSNNNMIVNNSFQYS